MAGDSFFTELRKRKVFRAAAIYGAVAWGLTEVIVTIVEQLFLPAWVATLTVIVFVVGFPVAMFLAWTFDITAEGIERTAISSRRGKFSIAGSIVLMVAGTAGLFFLIKPSIDQAAGSDPSITAPPNSVAVLPFENVSRSERDFYLSEGLSDELRDQLGRVQGLQIAARSSSVAIRNQAVGAAKTAAALGVAYVVEGSLRRLGNRLSVSVQLIDGRTGLSVWSDNYERGPLELLSVQQDIAREVINFVIPDAEPADATAAPATLDASANDLMLLARHYENQVRDKPVVDLELQVKAIELYRQAVAADPNSALAHSRLGAALMYIGDFDSAEAPIYKAVELDPNLSDVQTTLGKYLHYTLGIVAAQPVLQRSVELGPNNVDALSSHAWVAWGLEGTLAAEQLYRRALQLDPLSLSRHADLATFYGWTGQREATLQMIERIENTFDSAEAWRVIALLYEMTGDVDRAIAWVIRVRDTYGTDTETVSLLAELLAIIGEFEAAESVDPDVNIGVLFQMRRYEDIIDEGGMLLIEEPNDVVLRYTMAFAFNALGQFDNALRMLQATGLQGDVRKVRSAPDMEAIIYLADALNGAGETGLAHEIASRVYVDVVWSSGADWWEDVFPACAQAIIEMHEQALARLEKATTSPRIPWEPLVRDAPCFARYADAPAYRSLLEHIDERKAELRAKLPATLAEFDVSL